MNKNINKKYILIIPIILAILLLLGGTYAVWSWRSNESSKTNVTLTTTQNYSCSADGGGNITTEDVTLIPTFCTNDPYVIRRTITTNVVNGTNGNIYMDLWLKVNNISEEISNSNNFKYALTDSATSCTSGNVLAQGTLNEKMYNSTIDLLINDTYATSGTKTYYLYIWLDTPENNRDTMEQDLELELHGSCSEKSNTNIPNNPDVIDGLIPVKLSTSGDTVTTVTENDPTWYNYNEKKWANAVLVTNDGTKGVGTTRNYYLTHPGETVAESDILAYYVWIPRYSYKVWQYEGIAEEVKEREIDIKFIPTSTIDIATQNDEWYTHPAFWWDDDSDGVREEGEELAGIWVGKFATGHATLSSSVSNNLGTCTSDSCNNYTGLRVLPNIQSLRRNKVATNFYASRFMESVNNPFGLNKATTDSHMMKNSEWGAVAYLYHSRYGNTYKLLPNNDTNYITGCREENNCSSDGYGNANNYLQSTTGNVTGVFDMSGGAYEYVMGVLNGENNDEYGSGFSILPDNKYYDNYPNTEINSTIGFTQCTLATCGGHALNETKSWYQASPSYPPYKWIIRGYYKSNPINGIFWSSGNCGQDSSANCGYVAGIMTFRLVLIKNIE